MRVIRRVSVVLASLLLLAAPAAAQQFEILHAFQAPPTDPTAPHGPTAPPIDGPDGALYGTTISGGAFNLGTFYRLTSSGFTVLYSFTSAGGSHPAGKLVVGADGKFYGTAYDGGGAANAGAIFRISAAGVFERLHSFSILNGRNPTAGLTRVADGAFWGTTVLGGSADSGTIFKISPAGVFTLVHSFVFQLFTENTSVYPFAGVIQAQDGNIYGTTVGSGGVIGGTVFRLTPDGALTRLWVFSGSFDIFSSANGPKVYAGLVEASNGVLYGGACCGGSFSPGSEADPPQVFQISSTSAGPLREMSDVFSALTEGSDGALYGATSAGLLFRLETNGTFTELKSLAESEGVFPSGVRTAGDWIMGSTYGGGPGGGGVIFRFRRD